MSPTNDDGVTGRSPRKGKRIDPVSELSCFLTVKPGREQLIREVLDAPPDQQKELIKAVKDVGTLHNARYVLFDNDRRLIIATTFDGDWDVYIDDFAASKVLDVWDTFLIHCEGYPDEGKDAAGLSVDDVKEYLTEYQVTAADFFLRYPGVTTKEVLEALRVQAAVQESLDNPGAGEALQHPALKPLREVSAD